VRSHGGLLHPEGAEAQVPQRSWGCPLPGRVRARVVGAGSTLGWEHPGLGQGPCPGGGGVGRDGSLPTPTARSARAGGPPAAGGQQRGEIGCSPGSAPTRWARGERGGAAAVRSPGPAPAH